MAKSPQLRFIIKDLNEFVSKTMVALALQILANLVAPASRGGTPVDTGWARANWVPNIGSPVTGPIGTRPKSKIKRFTKGLRNAVQTSNQAGLIRYQLEDGPIYITNAVPYILRLNMGSSKQAAAGFVQLAIVRAAQKIASLKKVGK